MFDREPRLTVDEQLLVRRSADLESTRRRIRLSLLSAGVLAAGVATAGWALRPWRPLAALFVVYILVTTWERVAYGRSVLRYKSLVQKLQQLLRDADRSAGGAP
jgi:hypothetical protein